MFNSVNQQNLKLNNGKNKEQATLDSTKKKIKQQKCKNQYILLNYNSKRKWT
jgi:hypothetical protein